MMQHVYQKTWVDEYKIHSYDVDGSGCLSLPMLCKLMQESAWNHAENLRLGYSHLLKRGLIWVLSRQLIEINSFPKWGEVIRIHTWPSAKERLFFHRDFRIIGEKDTTLGVATTTWFAIDLKSRRPHRLDSEHDDLYENAEHATDRQPQKLEPATLPDSPTSFDVRYHELDVNGHVNNATYVEWILESHPIDFLKSHTLSEFEINYLSEALYGDGVSVFSDGQGLEYKHSLVRDKGGKELCRARTLWR